MPFIAGGFSRLMDMQKVNGTNKSERKSDCGTSISACEAEAETETEHNVVADVPEFQAKSRQELQSDEKKEIVYHDLEHIKELTWKIANFFHLPTYEDYYIESETFSVANASWCLRMYPNGKKEDTSGQISLYLVRVKSCNSMHRIHYRFGFRSHHGDKLSSLVQAATYHTDAEEMGFINIMQRLDVLHQKKNLAKGDVLTVFCDIFMIENVTVPLLNPTSGRECLEMSVKTGELCLQSALSNPEIYVWRINDFLKLPVDEGYFIESAEFSFDNATWCMRLYPNGQSGYHKGCINLFLVRKSALKEKHCIKFRLGFNKLKYNGLGECIHDITSLTNDIEIGVVNILNRSDIKHIRKCLKNDTLTTFCHLYLMSEYRFPISSYTVSKNQHYQSSSEVKLTQTEDEENILESYPKTIFSIQDIFTWNITKIFELHLSGDDFRDSNEFCFANSTWCLRLYPNGKGKNQTGWVHLMLVQLQCSDSRLRHQIHYRLGFKLQDEDLHEALIHTIILHGNASEIGIVDPLKRLDVTNILKKSTHDVFLIAYCQLEEIELSKCVETPKYQSNDLAKQSRKSCLNPVPVTPCQNAFFWMITNFIKLPMDEGYFIDTEAFTFANAMWCLRMYPNGQKGQNCGWIQLSLIRLHSDDSQQCIQYQLGLKWKRNKVYGTLTHVACFHKNAEEAGVVNLIKRLDINCSKKKFIYNSFLTVICQLSMPNISIVEIPTKMKELKTLTNTKMAKKSENTSVGVLHKLSFLDVLDLIWKIPSFIIQPMQVGHWMDSPTFSFLNDNWCLRFYMKEKNNSKDCKIYMYLVRFNTCCYEYLISYELSIQDNFGKWLKFEKNNCQGIYANHVMKLGVSNLHFLPCGFVVICLQMVSKEREVAASELTCQPKHHLEFPLNDVERYGPSQFPYGVLYEKPILEASEVSWTIPDFFELRKEVDGNVNSPVFNFAGNNWMLQCYPNGMGRMPGRISFALASLLTCTLQHNVLCYFFAGSSTNVISRWKLEKISKKKSPTSPPVHLNLSEIMNKPEAIVPDSTLRVFCRLHVCIEKESNETSYLESP